MTKIKYSALAAATILSVSIAGAQSLHRIHHEGADRSVKTEILRVNDKTFHIGTPEKTDKARKEAGRSNAKRVVGVIDTPQGTPQEYSKNSGGFYFYGNYNSYMDADQAATIYWDGNDAYIYNILSYKETDTYVKGTRNGNTLSVPANQRVARGDGFDIMLGLLKTVLVEVPNPDWEEGDDEEDKNMIYVNFVYSNDYESIEYSIDSDGTITLVLPDAPSFEAPDDGYTYINPADYGFPDYALGFYYTDDLEWTGDADIRQEYIEFNYTAVEMPENLKFDYYSYLNHYDVGVLVYVAQVGDEVYVKGLSAYAPESVFKGTIKDTDNGKIISVPQNQFIGKSEDGYYNLLTRAVKYYRGSYTQLPEDEDAVFEIITDENGVITHLKGSSTDNILVFNYAGKDYDPYDEFPGVSLRYQESLEGEPMPPREAYFEDHSKWLGANYLFFYFDQFTAEGNILDINCLYYRIFVNGEPYEFVQHNGENLNGNFITMYQGMTPGSTLVPYTFYNGNDLFSDEFHLYYVGFYTWDIESLGVQTVYVYGEEPIYSEIVNVEVSKVENIETDDISSSEFYTLDGRKVLSPDKGIFIRVDRLSNGKTSVKKIVI